MVPESPSSSIHSHSHLICIELFVYHMNAQVFCAVPVPLRRRRPATPALSPRHRWRPLSRVRRAREPAAPSPRRLMPLPRRARPRRIPSVPPHRPTKATAAALTPTTLLHRPRRRRRRLARFTRAQRARVRRACACWTPRPSCAPRANSCGRITRTMRRRAQCWPPSSQPRRTHGSKRSRSRTPRCGSWQSARRTSSTRRVGCAKSGRPRDVSLTRSCNTARRATSASVVALVFVSVLLCVCARVPCLVGGQCPCS